jgi:hypothetical protein
MREGVGVGGVAADGGLAQEQFGVTIAINAIIESHAKP